MSQFPVKYVKLEDYETTYWRHQHHNEKCLATCEAIYYFYKEYDIAKNRQTDLSYQYDGKYDNLLFYYMLQFKMMERMRLEPKSKGAQIEKGGEAEEESKKSQ